MATGYRIGSLFGEPDQIEIVLPDAQNVTDGKLCRGCKRNIPRDQFDSRRAQRCIKCLANRTPRQLVMAKYEKNHRRRNREYRRMQGLVRRYGITPKQYQDMHDRQSGTCAICRKPETSTFKDKHRHKAVKPLAVDHCHKTGKVRGLLCSRCNRAIGLFEDNAELLAEASEYVKKQNRP